MEVELEVPEDFDEADPIFLGWLCNCYRVLRLEIGELRNMLELFLLAVLVTRWTNQLPIHIANFSNGQLVPSSTQREDFDITVYKKKGESGKRRKIMVAHTDHMTYVGTNYETEAGLAGPLPCRWDVRCSGSCMCVFIFFYTKTLLVHTLFLLKCCWWRRYFLSVFLCKFNEFTGENKCVNVC